MPGDPWRYEVFTNPDEPLGQEQWSTWDSQERNPWYRIEAEHQTAFFAVSCELGRRLQLGELVGWGHFGTLVGEWREIPAEAWRHLRVTYRQGLPGWRDGHVAGAGMEFWGVRLVDMVGLPLRAACLAYGNPVAASVMARASAFGADTGTPQRKKSKLDLRMEESPTPDLRMPGQPSAEEVAAASLTLETELLTRLQSGALSAHGTFPNGRQPIPPSSWFNKGRANFEHSWLQLEKDDPVRDVLVRPAIEQGTVATESAGFVVPIDRTDKTAARDQAEDDCRRWLVENWLPRQATKEGWRAAHRKLTVGRISGTAFDRAWEEAAKNKPEMRRPGRPKRGQKSPK